MSPAQKLEILPREPSETAGISSMRLSAQTPAGCDSLVLGPWVPADTLSPPRFVDPATADTLFVQRGNRLCVVSGREYFRMTPPRHVSYMRVSLTGMRCRWTLPRRGKFCS